jgi:hypothetical protein
MAITRAVARQTTLMYLLMGLPAVPTLMYLPRAFVVSGDAAVTAQRITDGGSLYRLIVLGGLISAVGFLLLAWCLYHLFENVDRKQARLLVMFVLVSVALGVADVVVLSVPLLLQSGASYLAVLGKTQLDALTLGTFDMRNHLLGISETFWGLWLLPFGLLVIKSGFIPKVIGVLLIMGCFAWLTLSVISIVAPHAHLVESLVFPLTAPGELSILGWLIVKSLTPKQTEAQLAYAR